MRTLATLVLLPLLLTLPLSAQKVALKCATLAPEGSTWMKSLEALNADVYRRTRGRIAFKFFAGGIAGEENAVLEKLRYGQLSAAVLTGVGLGGIARSSRILELPFYYRNLAEYDAVKAVVLPKLVPEFEAAGFQLLGLAEAGQALIASKRRIESIADARKGRVWLRPQDPLTAAIFKKMAIEPVPLSLPEVLTGVQTGTVDTVYGSPLSLIALQWFPHTSHVLDLPLVNIEAGLVVSKKAFDSLDAQDQKTLRTLAAQHIEQMVKATRADDLEARKVLIEKGITFVTPEKENVTEFENACRDVAKEMVGQLYDAELLALVNSTLETVRSQQPNR